MSRHATITSFKSGSEHPCWKGGIENFDALAPRTQEDYCHIEAREIMGSPKGVVHHKDGNVRNRAKDNLVVLPSQSEHVAIHNHSRTGQHKRNSLQVAFKDAVFALNEPSRKVAEKLGISKSTVLRIRRRWNYEWG